MIKTKTKTKTQTNNKTVHETKSKTRTETGTRTRMRAADRPDHARDETGEGHTAYLAITFQTLLNKSMELNQKTTKTGN